MSDSDLAHKPIVISTENDWIPAKRDLYIALGKALQKIDAPKKNAKNPAFGQTKYADLRSVYQACREALHEEGLLVVQAPRLVDGVLILRTEIIHEQSGQFLFGEIPIVSADPTNPQKIGSAITYFRRYSLLTMLGLAPEDDDGNSATRVTVAPDPKARLGTLLKDTGISKMSELNAKTKEKFEKTWANLTVKDVEAWINELESSSSSVPF